MTVFHAWDRWIDEQIGCGLPIARAVRMRLDKRKHDFWSAQGLPWDDAKNAMADRPKDKWLDAVLEALHLPDSDAERYTTAYEEEYGEKPAWVVRNEAFARIAQERLRVAVLTCLRVWDAEPSLRASQVLARAVALEPALRGRTGNVLAVLESGRAYARLFTKGTAPLRPFGYPRRKRNNLECHGKGHGPRKQKAPRSAGWVLKGNGKDPDLSPENFVPAYVSTRHSWDPPFAVPR